MNNENTEIKKPSRRVLEPGEKLQAGDEYFQYGVWPADWRKVDGGCVGLAVLPVGAGTWGTVYCRAE